MRFPLFLISQQYMFFKGQGRQHCVQPPTWRICQRYWVFELSLTEVQWLRLALSKGPHRVGFFPHLKTKTDPVSETSCSCLVCFLIPGRWIESENPISLKVIHHRQHPIVTTGGSGLCIYILQWQGSPAILAGTPVSLFVAFHDSQVNGGSILARLHTEGGI
jgi:hypothetical protein